MIFNKSILDRQEIAAAFAVSFLLVAGISYFQGTARQIIGDPYLYFIQAHNPLSVISPPHGLRWLTPRIAYFIPLSLNNAFYGVTLVALSGTLALAYLNLRVFRCRPLTAAAVFGAFLAHPEFHYSLFYYIHVDPLSFFLIELGVLAVYTHNDRLFAVSLLLGVLNRETSLFLIPVYHFAREKRWRTLPSIRRTLAICSAPLAAFFITRFLLFTLSDTAYIDNLAQKFYALNPGFKRFDLYYLNEIKKLWMEPGRFAKVLSPSILSGGFQSIAPLALLGFYFAERRQKAMAFFLVCIWSQPLYALMAERLTFHAFPAILLGCGLALSNTQQMKQSHRYPFLALTFALGAIAPQSWIAGVGLTILLLGLMHFNHTTFQKRSSTSNSTSPCAFASFSQSMKTSFNWINAVVLSIVVANIAAIYTFRPVLVQRLNDSFKTIRQVSKMNLQDSSPVFIGNAKIEDFTLSDDRIINTFSVASGEAPTKIFLPLCGTPLSKMNRFFLIDIVYPTAPSNLNIAVVGPLVQRDTGRLHYKTQIDQKYGATQRMGLLRKSLLLPFESDLPSKDILVVKITPNVFLIDILFFKGNVYAWFQRTGATLLNSKSIELN